MAIGLNTPLRMVGIKAESLELSKYFDIDWNLIVAHNNARCILVTLV